MPEAPCRVETVVISSDAHYMLMLGLAFGTEMGHVCTLEAPHIVQILGQYRIPRSDGATVLREAVARGHARQDAQGRYTITEAGVTWIEVEAAVRRSADDARRTHMSGG